MSVKIVEVGVAEAEQVFQIMRLAFEEYRGKLYPESGALRETLEDVRAGIRSGCAFLAFAREIAAGSARFRLFPTTCTASESGCSPPIAGWVSQSNSRKQSKRLRVLATSRRCG